MIRRFLADTVDLILGVLDKIGVVRGGGAWWRARVQRRLDAAENRVEMQRRAVESRYRMCRECRALVPNREKTCDSCGAVMSGVPRGGAGRLLSLLVPSLGSVSTTMMGVIGVVYLASILGPVSQGAGGGFSPDMNTLYYLGAKIQHVPMSDGSFQRFVIWNRYEYWRLLNPVFLHGGILHLLFNCYALMNLGPVLEHAIGPRRFLVFFVWSGVISFIASAVWSPYTLSVGSSGVIFGLIGLGIVFGYRRMGGLAFARETLIRWALFGAVMMLMPGLHIDNAAHLGGFLAGVSAGFLFDDQPPRSPTISRLWSIAALVSGIMIPAGFAAALFHWWSQLG